ncbi:chemotaxis protein CheA [Parageobacillus thermoglucosidasius]|uniref:chemotaxis protein CheA n=1 Tax=Parageobacillus thermoglucosidasius TaxID=1426 RepID=UPI000E15570C|nr:chemotaxis protein CheA [Parageobacillus thermoglucosidasius]MED4904351.1 chemotaxis protein CheA [Parageobacillus thermoglucosidasius]MED4912389.1 chemotaxis protein CheA [Parageobacillus thermoglucosidasius]MED4943501.1 chemotaxis protein CheA [Parageobacillus thermoglucosidasius]MED4983187.1 chemotaxis protein CheA [Parageobacillus thermoglucosidasius]RDE27632.1 chemotaxis protein CheA [Parageobacillus thermoglucosidasius]
MDMSQYLEIFVDESKEHLQTINEQLLELEKTPEDMTIVNEIFRSAHTLKGMSATMGFEDLANLTHQMENVLDGIRNHKITVTSEILDVVFQAVDHLEAMIMSIAEGGDGKRDVREVVERLKRIERGESPAELAAATAAESPSSSASFSQTYGEFEYNVLQQSKEQGFSAYEIRVKLRDDCLLKAARVFMVFEALNEMGEVIKSNPSVEMLEEEQFDQEFVVTVVSKKSAEELYERIMKVSEIEEVDVVPFDVEERKKTDAAEAAQAEARQQEAATVQAKQQKQTKDSSEPNAAAKQSASTNKTIRVNIERLDILMNLFEELVIDRGRLEQISRELNHPELHETVERMSRISSDLQNIILNMRMVPVETVFNRFPRMVRQLARELGKKVNLEIIGAETELDRTVIDEIGDPLVHLLRNAIDHGIETPDVRRASGKPEEGTVKLKAYHSGNHVFIEIEDDGAGINRDKVLRKAIDKGIVSKQNAENLTDRQIYELIFAPGFSTADKISDISGRGVGLDVVKSTIESLGGTVTVDSEEGSGSIFSIQLPLTLSIISVLLVEIQQEKYAIPLSSIIETAIIKKEDIFHTHNQQVIDFRGKVVPLVFLKEIFEIPTVTEEEEFVSVVIVRKGEKMAGLVVDSFIGQQEVVLKSLGNYLTSVFAISGATILGDGQVALIIDCNSLIK